MNVFSPKFRGEPRQVRHLQVTPVTTPSEQIEINRCARCTSFVPVSRHSEYPDRYCMMHHAVRDPDDSCSLFRSEG